MNNSFSKDNSIVLGEIDEEDLSNGNIDNMSDSKFMNDLKGIEEKYNTLLSNLEEEKEFPKNEEPNISPIKKGFNEETKNVKENSVESDEEYEEEEDQHVEEEDEDGDDEEEEIENENQNFNLSRFSNMNNSKIIKKELKSLQGKIIRINEERNAYQRELNRSVNLSMEKSSLIMDARERVTELTQKVKKLREEKVAWLKEKEQLLRSKNQLYSKFVKNLKTFESIEHQFKTIKIDNQKYSQLLKTRDEKIAEQNEKLSNFKQRFQDMEKHVNELESKMEEKEKKFRSEKRGVKKLEEEIDILKRKLGSISKLKESFRSEQRATNYLQEKLKQEEEKNRKSQQILQELVNVNSTIINAKKDLLTTQYESSTTSNDEASDEDAESLMFASDEDETLDDGIGEERTYVGGKRRKEYSGKKAQFPFFQSSNKDNTTFNVYSMTQKGLDRSLPPPNNLVSPILSPTKRKKKPNTSYRTGIGAKSKSRTSKRRARSRPKSRGKGKPKSKGKRRKTPVKKRERERVLKGNQKIRKNSSFLIRQIKDELVGFLNEYSVTLSALKNHSKPKDIARVRERLAVISKLIKKKETQLKHLKKNTSTSKPKNTERSFIDDLHEYSIMKKNNSINRGIEKRTKTMQLFNDLKEITKT